MTLFQLVTVENPVKLTPKAKVLWPQLREQLEKVNVSAFLKNTVEGLEIGLNLIKSGDNTDENPYFVELVHRDLDS